VREFLGGLLLVFLIVLAVRAILSWFPARHGTFLAQLNSFLFDLTEPVLRPVRRFIPPMGGFDLSFMVVFFFIVLLRGAILNG
jgi:YggT family protein